MQPVSVDQLAQLLDPCPRPERQESRQESSPRCLSLSASARPGSLNGKQNSPASTPARLSPSWLTRRPSSTFPHPRCPIGPRPTSIRIRLILNHSVAYVNKTIHSLPNFYARRTTARYEDPAARFFDRQLLCNSARLGYFLCGPQARRIATDAELHNTRLTGPGKLPRHVTYVDGKEATQRTRSAAVSRSNGRSRHDRRIRPHSHRRSWRRP